MKNNNTLPKSTEDLLRAPLPDSEARPGFETRLICNLNSATTSPRRFTWLPFAMTATALLVALLTVLPLLNSPDKPSSVTVLPDPPVTSPKPVFDLDEFSNPLRKEATAMSDTATRAGQFLINCLPSLPTPEGTL